MQNSNFSFYLSPQALEWRDTNRSVNDLESQFEDFNDGSTLNLNGSFEEECLRTYQNFSYYNVSCDTPTAFSVPLYGEKIYIYKFYIESKSYFDTLET